MPNCLIYRRWDIVSSFVQWFISSLVECSIPTFRLISAPAITNERLNELLNNLL